MGKPAFETVVAEHGPTVLRICRAVLAPADADDAWSETFLAAMAAYPALGEDANTQAWLVTIAHRKAIDVHRSTTRRAVPLEQLPEPPVVDARDEVDPDLVDAVAALPTKQKQCVAYHHLGGLTYREIAGLLGGSADAARRAAADGVATLRRTYPNSAEKEGRP